MRMRVRSETEALVKKRCESHCVNKKSYKIQIALLISNQQINTPYHFHSIAEISKSDRGIPRANLSFQLQLKIHYYLDIR